MKLLLLEDDRDAREALATLLALDGFVVEQAGNEQGFEAAVARSVFDAVIFDLHLHGRTGGLDLVMRYQARRVAAGQAPARLICLTGSLVDAELDADLPFRVDSRLRKPADYGAILAALRARVTAH